MEWYEILAAATCTVEMGLMAYGLYQARKYNGPRNEKSQSSGISILEKRIEMYSKYKKEDKDGSSCTI